MFFHLVRNLSKNQQKIFWNEFWKWKISKKCFKNSHFLIFCGYLNWKIIFNYQKVKRNTNIIFKKNNEQEIKLNCWKKHEANSSSKILSISETIPTFEEPKSALTSYRIFFVKMKNMIIRCSNEVGRVKILSLQDIDGKVFDN